VKAALRRAPTHQQGGTMARAKALRLEEERGEVLRASLLIQRAVGGFRSLLVAGAKPDIDDLGALLASIDEYAYRVRDHLTRRR
jgi:hypothetical protein